MRVCLQYHQPDPFNSFRDLLFRSRLGPDAPGYLDVSPRTLRRWRTQDSAPLWARRLLILKQSDLGGLWPAWAGFRFAGNELWTPEDNHFTPGEIRAVHWLAQKRPVKRPASIPHLNLIG